MRIDFGKSWCEGIRGRTIKQITELYNSRNLNPLLDEQQESVANELLAHFNHPAHNFGARRLERNLISAGGRYPFNASLNVHTWTDLFDRLRTEPEGFFGKLFGSHGSQHATYFEIPALKGHIEYQCENPDPREVLDILRLIGYGASIYQPPLPSPNQGCGCRRSLDEFDIDNIYC